ncbi:hypothetical protein CORC01_13785 [Colletotrichum orchidophilum]|uniref:Uncharacterized protein n=1 Tax=Colletotrichum orchidophilum TaxID=1209926 RepID=A0A1G4ANY8_9PEZI|nr:uncharacterized protein CORC01_13785 [Colletotrichum orchidophilum]OHE90900.1 hypothetical protein CORC01_13785 [Colletotrichum orchidophilum]
MSGPGLAVDAAALPAHAPEPRDDPSVAGAASFSFDALAADPTSSPPIDPPLLAEVGDVVDDAESLIDDLDMFPDSDEEAEAQAQAQAAVTTETETDDAVDSDEDMTVYHASGRPFIDATEDEATVYAAAHGESEMTFADDESVLTNDARSPPSHGGGGGGPAPSLRSLETSDFEVVSMMLKKTSLRR